MLVGGLQFVAQFAQLAENRTRVLRVVAVRRHGHESAYAEMRKFRQGGKLRAELVGRESMFGLLAGNIHFEQSLSFRSGFARNAIDGSGQSGAVDAVEEGEEREGLADFIFLQVADEVPLQV